MYLRSLLLHNFRNYEEEVFHFGPRLNIIYGANAQGKTSLLEALYFLITGRSFRTSHVKELIRHNTTHFTLEAHFTKHGIDQILRVSSDGKTRKMMCNQTNYQISDLIGLVKGVVMTPDDIELVKGSPQSRRSFLDMHITQHSPLYVHHLTRYNRALKQRNQMLKSKVLHSIESWEQEMAKAAAFITMQRLRTIQELDAKSHPLHRSISNQSEELALHYKPQALKLETEEIVLHYYLEQFSKHRKREMELGITFSGPHKDDVIMSINKHDIRTFASEGQQRSCIVALKLAEWQRLKDISEEIPVMMMDDIGVSLDDARRDHLFSQLHHLGQVFLTTTQENSSLTLSPQDKSFHISGR